MTKRRFSIFLGLIAAAVVLSVIPVFRVPIQASWFTWRLGSQHTEVAWDAAESLVDLGYASEVEDWYIDKLDSAIHEERRAAARALTTIRSAKAVPSLIAFFGDPRMTAHLRGVGEQLGTIGEQKVTPHMKVLVKYLNSTNEDVKKGAIFALGQIGGAEAVRLLKKELTQGRVFCVLMALRSLGEIGPPAVAALPELMQIVNGEDAYLRVYAFLAIRDIGPGASAEVATIAKFLTRSEELEAETAAMALIGIGDQSAARALIAHPDVAESVLPGFLGDSYDEMTRLFAQQTLDTIRKLRDRAQDNNPHPD